jgi:acetyl-CoA C-acetyltransferase
MMPDLYLADALGATDKPIMRVHTAGVGGVTAIVASLTEDDGPEHPLAAL